MPPQKECPNCKQDNLVRSKKCKHCNADLKKKRGRPVGTTKSAGYRVGTNGGRPRKITANGSSSCVTSKQGKKRTKASSDETKGKPSGSNEIKGVGVCRTRGRPMGSTEAKGCRVGKSGGRPIGSTEANGFDVSKAGGRPIGTTKVKGFGVGLSGGVYAGSQSNVLFKDNIELPDEWYTSSETVNVDDCLLRRCASRIVQQRVFDSQPLAIGLCYSCGRVLWNPSHAHYSGLVTPSGMTPDDAPATAYLRASPNSNLSFVQVKGDCEKMALLSSV